MDESRLEKMYESVIKIEQIVDRIDKMGCTSGMSRADAIEKDINRIATKFETRLREEIEPVKKNLRNAGMIGGIIGAAISAIVMLFDFVKIK